MTGIIRLDLRGLISPLNLLKCKSCLKEMETGTILEVLISDRDVLSDLLTIVERSADKIAYQNMADGVALVGIQKGQRPQHNL